MMLPVDARDLGRGAPFVRTVLGDIAPADLGVTYAHEHLVIDGGRMVEMSPDFLLADADKAVAELGPAARLGLRSVVDAMPCDLGRNVVKLAEISRRSGVNVVASTGLHLALYYPGDHWSRSMSADELTRHFIADVEEGIDDADDHGSTIRRTADDNGPTTHQAGVIKVAGGRDTLSVHEVKVFQAAAAAHRLTGVPILTHCTDGTAALEQIRLLTGAGVPPVAITVSHTDKVVDRVYHREILATGVFVDYDQAFRWPAGADNETLTLLRWMLEDGFGDRLMLGLDAARQGYWSTYGGRPGMAFLLGEYCERMAAAGITAEARQRIFVDNPARAFAFTMRGGQSADPEPGSPTSEA
jgi:phosphotriesterase-related protein